MYYRDELAKKIICGLDEYDPIIGINRLPCSSKTYYVEEEGKFDCPKILTYDGWYYHFKNKSLEIFTKPFPFVSYREINDITSEKYFYVIRMSAADFFEKNKKIGFKCLNQKLIQDVKNNQAKIIITYTDEGSSGIFNLVDDFKIIQYWIDELNLPAKNIYFFTGNLKAKELHNFEYNIVCIHIWDSLNNPSNVELVDYNNISKLYLNLNRTRNTHRALFLTCLHKENLLNAGLNSFDYVTDCSFTIWDMIKSIDENLIDHANELQKEGKRVIDQPYTNYFMNSLINLNLYRETFCSVITESLSEKNTLHFSEKTWKSFMIGHPFMVLSSPGALAYLRKEGFKTYSTWFDESYDEEPDLYKRVQKIINNLKKYENYSLEELKKVRADMQETIIYNRQHLIEHYNKKYTWYDGAFSSFKPHIEKMCEILDSW